MGSFKLGKMTLRSLFGKPATVQYPNEKPEVFPALRGHVECDMNVCILCGMCGRACPVGAIAVDRKGGTWQIDPYRCIQCACCVGACPKKCLSMSTECAPATTELTVTTLHKPEEPSAAEAGAGAGAGAKAAGVAGGAAADKPARKKMQLTPEQEARIAAAKARKAAKDAEKAAAAKDAADAAE